MINTSNYMDGLDGIGQRAVFLSGLWRTALDTRQAVTLDTTEGVKVKKRLVTGCV